MILFTISFGFLYERFFVLIFSFFKIYLLFFLCLDSYLLCKFAPKIDIDEIDFGLLFLFVEMCLIFLFAILRWIDYHSDSFILFLYVSKIALEKRSFWGINNTHKVNFGTFVMLNFYVLFHSSFINNIL